MGDVDDHRLSLSTFSGLAFFANGVVAKVQFHSIADYVAGVGTFTLYPVIHFDDDSVLLLKGSGTGTVDGARTKGDGTLTGTRYTPLSD